MNDYYAAHPEDVPEWWGNRKVDEGMVIAFGRLFLYNWSIEQAFADLERGGIEPSVTPIKHGSNQFAVSPARSAEGVAILAIDNPQTLETIGTVLDARGLASRT